MNRQVNALYPSRNVVTYTYEVIAWVGRLVTTPNTTSRFATTYAARCFHLSELRVETAIQLKRTMYILLVIDREIESINSRHASSALQVPVTDFIMKIYLTCPNAFISQYHNELLMIS